MTFDRSEVGVVTERTEVEGEPFEIPVGHLLVRESEHLVFQPGGANGPDRVSGEIGCEINAGHRGATGSVSRFDS